VLRQAALPAEPPSTGASPVRLFTERSAAEADIQLLLGRSGVRLDIAARKIELSAGARLPAMTSSSRLERRSVESTVTHRDWRHHGEICTILSGNGMAQAREVGVPGIGFQFADSVVDNDYSIQLSRIGPGGRSKLRRAPYNRAFCIVA
jgi:hypothetical protein